MTLLMSILLGFVQGVAEFLPISSSGHLSIIQNLFKLQYAEEEHLLFDVLLHLGTLVSVCIVYRKELWSVIKDFISLIKQFSLPEDERRGPTPSGRLAVMIIIATLPLVVVLPFKSKVESLYYNTTFIGIALLVTGFVLFISDKIRRGRKNEKNMTVKDAVVVGVCQAFACVPGLSRSGMTISGGILSGFDREFAVRFSFLLSIPAILGANILQLFSAFKSVDTKLIPTYLAGVVTAGVVGYFAIRLVKSLSKKNKFGKFAYYCWAVGVITIILSIVL